MKVLHLTSGNLYGGIETYLLTLARMRHLCPTMEPHFGLCFPGRIRDELAATGVGVHDLAPVRVSRPWTVLRARMRLRRLLRGVEFDAVVGHGTWVHAVFAPVVKRSSARFVHAVHGDMTGRNWLDRWAARTPPDAVIANSRFTARTAERVFPGCPTSVVHPPVPAPADFDRAAACREIRAESATPGDATVILMVSRIEELKGHTVLLRALGDLQEVSGWICWIVGSAQRPHEIELLANLRELAKRLAIADRVRFLGQRADVSRVMAAADIYCQPNTGPEGFGIAFVEALYAGLPVVSSDFGGAAEIVTQQCGVLCPPGDSDAVAVALRGLIAEPVRRRALGGAGAARADELCNLSRQLSVLAENTCPRVTQ